MCTMLVLMDLEWTEHSNGEKELTQIAAVRMDEQWNKKEKINLLVCPAEDGSADWAYMAFSGYEAKDFLSGRREADCLQALERWLLPADVIGLWSRSAKCTLLERWKHATGQDFSYPVSVVNDWIYDTLRKRKQYCHGLYTVAEVLDINPEGTEHCAKNDVSVLYQVLWKSGLTQEQLVSGKKIGLTGRELIEKMPYNYFYTPTSAVFHTKTCAAIMRAKNICGCATYKTAIRNRRPCALCHPADLSKLTESRSENLPDAREQEASKDKEPVWIRLFDGSVIRTYRHKIVGCCHYSGHPGKMHRKLMEKHDCIGKQCRYFQKNEQSTYWENAQRQALAKEKKKKAQQEEKDRQRQKALRLQTIGDELQYYLDLCGYQVDILQIEETWPEVFKVLYVSDKPYADGHLYQEFYSTIRYLYPNRKIMMRHIKNENGYFVTLDEYYSRRRA